MGFSFWLIIGINSTTKKIKRMITVYCFLSWVWQGQWTLINIIGFCQKLMPLVPDLQCNINCCFCWSVTFMGSFPLLIFIVFHYGSIYSYWCLANIYRGDPYRGPFLLYTRFHMALKSIEVWIYIDYDSENNWPDSNHAKGLYTV